VEYKRQTKEDNIIRCMRIACWISKATDTHLEYVVLIAFLPQQWLHERASILRYTNFSLSCKIRIYYWKV